MADFLGLEHILPYAKLLAFVCGGALVFIALAAFAYTMQTTFRPWLVAMQWLIGHTPGEKPSDIVRGISQGIRLLVWSMLIGVTVFLLFH